MTRNTTLSEPFGITVEPINTAPTPQCDCTEEAKDARTCPHMVDNLLLLLPSGEFRLGYWGGTGWASDEGDIISPIGWARLPTFSAQLRAAA